MAEGNVYERKRRRHPAWRNADIFFFWTCSSLCASAGAFTFHNQHRKSSSRNELVVSMTTSTASATIIEKDYVGRQEEEDSAISRRILLPCSVFGASKQIFSEPPYWLERYSGFSDDQVDHEVRWLEYRLLEQRFQIEDVRLIVDDIFMVVDGDNALFLGILDFLKTMLSVLDDVDDEGDSVFLSTPVLRASIIHYANCVAAERQVTPEMIRQFFKAPRTDVLALSPSKRSCPELNSSSISNSLVVVPPQLSTYSELPLTSSRYDEIRAIVKGAAKITRTEFLVKAILKDRAVSSSYNVRNLLLSTMGDWRSLGIRLAACLYRLESVIEYNPGGTNEYLERSPEVVRTAREALKIYAPLAQRLGLQSLKARIEANAFRILYRRQYKAANFIFRETGQAMHALSSYLLSDITRTLRADDALMSQLANMQVVSRVKEPYSFWKKLLKKRFKGSVTGSSCRNREQTLCSSLAISQVHDGVALRVILKAKKLPNETDETTRARESMLCYYVQTLIRQRWPEIEATRLKDYIAQPKANGYQSLHHTSTIVSSDVEFPFEVQVRSEEMHRLAEFGVAAHWDYKLDSELVQLERGDTKSLAGTLLTAFSNDSPLQAYSSNQEGASSYVEALLLAQQEISTNQVYVFIVGGGKQGDYGELISLPSDAPIRFVAADIENKFSAKVQVWRNGRIAEVHDTLKSGDVVLVAL
ncbi:hypothetical protein ACA910_018595 [Epithemia clementina (nom. ined.)]